MDSENTQRSGPWSREEKTFIAENCDSMTYQDIARHLRRNPVRVKDYIIKTIGKKVVGSNEGPTPEYDIKRSPIWKQLQQSMSEEELQIFLYHWSRMVNQFKDDVLPTEELQIVDTIKIEILLHRCMKQQRTAIQFIEELEAEIAILRRAGSDDRDDLAEIDNKERMIAAQRSATETLGKEYNNLLEQKNRLLKDLKSTRADRIKSIENSKQSIIGWIGELLRNKNLRRELGLKMEKMRLAVDVEKLRLMDPHTYIDNQIDYPLLSSDTIDKLKEEAKNAV